MIKQIKTDQEWRESLSGEAYEVTRCGGTERAFSGEYWDCKDPGTYHCAGCDAALFSHEHKYDSGSGWPSYFQALSPNTITEIKDTSHGMLRTEVQCAACDSHLGHLFPDGPAPTGMRYCINSLSLTLKPEVK